jgi:hypothetical protein
VRLCSSNSRWRRSTTSERTTSACASRTKSMICTSDRLRSLSRWRSSTVSSMEWLSSSTRNYALNSISSRYSSRSRERITPDVPVSDAVSPNALMNPQNPCVRYSTCSTTCVYHAQIRLTLLDKSERYFEIQN